MPLPLTTQALESTSLKSCNVLLKNVQGQPQQRRRSSSGLYDLSGERKYQNRAERRRFLHALEGLDERRCLFGLVLAWTGARVTEVLALNSSSFQVEAGIVTFETLKQRTYRVREVRLPPQLMHRLERFFLIRKLQRGGLSSPRLWTFSRQTAWRLIKSVSKRAGFTGRRASPRGLRHAFGVETLSCGVPLPLISRWMGHTRMTTTAIYLSVSGAEELSFARRFWRGAVAHRDGQVEFTLAEAA